MASSVSFLVRLLTSWSSQEVRGKEKGRVIDKIKKEKKEKEKVKVKRKKRLLLEREREYV